MWNEVEEYSKQFTIVEESSIPMESLMGQTTKKQKQSH
jgi:hypothetical protein